MKIIITMSLLMSLGLAVPTARADGKDDFCESMRLGIRAYDALERDYPGVLKLLGLDSAVEKRAYRSFCGAGSPSWERRPKSAICGAAKAWHTNVSGWVEIGNMDGMRFSRMIAADFEKAATLILRAMGALGCP